MVSKTSKLSITTKAKEGIVVSIKRPPTGWNIVRKPVHPGEMLREEFLIPLGLSANKLAIELRVPVTRISEIVNERRAITADTALRLERYFGMSADFWLNLQKSFDLLSARRAHGKEIKTAIHPRSEATGSRQSAVKLA
jgi:addiction module HigA family antidote